MDGWKKTGKQRLQLERNRETAIIRWLDQHVFETEHGSASGNVENWKQILARKPDAKEAAAGSASGKPPQVRRSGSLSSDRLPFFVLVDFDIASKLPSMSNYWSNASFLGAWSEQVSAFACRDLDHKAEAANRLDIVLRGRSPSRRRFRTKLQRSSFPNFCFNEDIPLGGSAVNATRPPGFLEKQKSFKSSPSKIAIQAASMHCIDAKTNFSNKKGRKERPSFQFIYVAKNQDQRPKYDQTTDSKSIQSLSFPYIAIRSS